MHVEFVYILQSKYVRVLNINLMMYIYVYSVKKGKFKSIEPGKRHQKAQENKKHAGS